MSTEMNPPAGWYPDPESPTQLRFWDGSRWTAHRAPKPDQHHGAIPESAAPQEQTSPPTGRDETLGASEHSHHAEQSPRTTSWTKPGGSGSQQSSWVQNYPSHDPGMQQAQYSGLQVSSPPAAGRNWLAIWVIAGLGILLVVLIVVVVILFTRLGSDDESAPAAETAETQEDTDSGNPEGSDLAAGGSTSLQLEASQEAEVVLSVTEPGFHFLQTSSEVGVDPMLELFSADGVSIEAVDDGGADSENSFDAGMEVLLAPGEYTAVVSEYSGRAAEIELIADAPQQAEEIDAGEHSFSADRDSRWVAIVEVPAEATVIVDVQGSSGVDPMLNVLMPSGVQEFNDDRSGVDTEPGRSLDPYLELATDEGGAMLLEISEWSGAPLEGEVLLEIQD